jgi:hypothetical protein
MAITACRECIRRSLCQRMNAPTAWHSPDSRLHTGGSSTGGRSGTRWRWVSWSNSRSRSSAWTALDRVQTLVDARSKGTQGRCALARARCSLPRSPRRAEMVNAGSTRGTRSGLRSGGERWYGAPSVWFVTEVVASCMQRPSLSVSNTDRLQQCNRLFTDSSL